MRIFIGCSSSNNMPEKYISDCKNLISQIFSKDYDLVFGANNQGLMGLAYNIAKENKKEVIGICPEAYKADFQNLECNEEITTKSIEDRTAKLIELSDIIVFLPGGIGTIYELMATIESKRSNEYNKPILIYNSHGYFDKLLSFLEQIYNENITSSSVKNCYHISSDIDDAINFLNNN